MKPFLRWAGSKRQLLSVILKNIPGFTGRYIEPFIGSGSVFFALAPSEAVISDTNKYLIETYNAIKRSAIGVHDVYSSLQPNKEEYYRVREALPGQIDSVTRAGYFIYLNRYCFNGLYRTNKNGKFNVPFGGTTGNGTLPSLEALRAARRILNNAKCLHDDFETILNQARRGDFVFLDPPYFNPNARVFAEYGGNIFSKSDFDRLAVSIGQLHRKKILFMLTFSNTPLAQETFGSYFIMKESVRRSISGFSNARKREDELLITNYQWEN